MPSFAVELQDTGQVSNVQDTGIILCDRPAFGTSVEIIRGVVLNQAQAGFVSQERNGQEHESGKKKPQPKVSEIHHFHNREKPLQIPILKVLYLSVIRFFVNG